jgi:DNA-binding response OmpR family regulator
VVRDQLFVMSFGHAAAAHAGRSSGRYSTSAIVSPPLKVLLAANDDDQTRLIRRVLGASTNARVQVDYAPNGWDAQRQALHGDYDAVLLDLVLGDVDGETLRRRLQAVGVRAPALLLTSPGWDGVPDGGDDYLPKAEAVHGNTLVRAIVAMAQRHDLTRELVAAREESTQAATRLAELTHDLATPLGVVMGMTQILVADDNGLTEDGRACLEDVAREARRACEILKRLSVVGTAATTTARSVIADGPPIRRATVAWPGSRMVLIADDDAATRRLVCATLSSDQYTVLEAADGKDAWRLIREHHPAVAILDWQMPVYSGLELTDVIKGDPQVQGMTVIMLTGRSGQADREAGVRARADLYLIKPFSPPELLRAVEQALGITPDTV